jgi:hypothetical protein
LLVRKQQLSRTNAWNEVKKRNQEEKL